MITALDTNSIVRYLIRDDEQQLQQVLARFQSGEKFLISDVVIAEVIYVLLSFYKVKKQEICVIIREFLNLPCIIISSDYIESALEIYFKANIHFVDAYCLAMEMYEETEIFSFDKKLLKVEKNYKSKIN